MQQPGTCPPLAVRSFGLTDRGLLRKTNQDHFLVARLVKTLQIRQSSLAFESVERSEDQCHLFVVADGMGGHAAGEEASALAVESVEDFLLNTCQWFARCKGEEQDEVLADFQAALAKANARVWDEANAHRELSGMGTTLTLAYSLNDLLFVAHVGDSRCYLYRGGVLHALTRDHTLMAEMIRRGILTYEKATEHRLRHVMTNAIGGDSARVQVELHKVHLQPGDGLLLCTDGLTTMVGDEEIGRILLATDDPESACGELIRRANEAGGRDNITAVLARFEEQIK